MDVFTSVRNEQLWPLCHVPGRTAVPPRTTRRISAVDQTRSPAVAGSGGQLSTGLSRFVFGGKPQRRYRPHIPWTGGAVVDLVGWPVDRYPYRFSSIVRALPSRGGQISTVQYSHRLLGEALTGAATPVGSGGKPLLPP